MLICIAIAGLLTTVMPRRYEATMKFLVNNERADLVITPEKAPAYTSRADVTETEVNSEIELLKSQDLLENVVRDTRLYNSGKNEITNPSRLTIARALRTLQRDLKIEAVRKTNIVNVSYRAPDPDVAVNVLRDLGDRYLTAHLAAHSTPGTYKFFTEQVERYSLQLTRVRAALGVFHRQKQLFSLPQQQSAAVEQLASVEARLKTTNAEIAEQQARLSENQIQLAALPERVTTQVRSMPNQYAVEHLQSLLADLRNKRIDLAMKFKPGDRFLVEIDSQISATEQQLADIQTHSAAEQTTDLDTLHQSLKADSARGVIALKALEARRTELGSMHASYLAQLDSMDSNNATLQNLEQYEKEALENYALYSRRLDEARLADSLDQQRFSNVVAVEKPVSSPIPVFPKLSLNLAVGAFMGAFLSLALAFFKESKGNSSPAPENEPQFFPDRAYHAQAGD